jgi:H+-transporting ATPase
MTGDGVNDAPALRQAEVGVAVESAVDVARSAASLVLTQPGLSGILDAIDVGRRIYRRMLTFTLGMSVKKLAIPVFLAIGFLGLHTYVLSPRLLLLLMVTNDLSTMTLSSDRVRPAPGPERWHGGALVRLALALAVPWLVFLLTSFELARRGGALSAEASQTFGFLALVFMGQANVYLVRERGPFWSSMPGTATLLASALTVAITSALAVSGTFMAAVPPAQVLLVLLAAGGFAGVLDVAKARWLGRLVAGPGVQPAR